nr:probable thiopurine S-methyltransferase [Lytechinus pictus]
MDTGESIDKWQKRWDDGHIGFHKGKVHEMLSSFVDQLTYGKDKRRIFIPLCGKTIDIVWLWERGHEVVGVEAIEDAVIAFFKEQSMKYTVMEVSGIQGTKLYQNEDGRIKIYCCNLFELNSTIIGKFHAIWDRGSLVAIGPCDRVKYAALMSSLIEEGGRILLESYLYDKEQFNWKNHSPFTLNEDDIKALYEPKAQVQLLNKRDVLYDVFRQAGLEYMFAITLLLTFNCSK